MNLYRLLAERAEQGRPVRVGLIGAGKFGAMFLAQAGRTPGLHVLGIADLAPDRARETCVGTGWAPERAASKTFADALKSGGTCVVDDAAKLLAEPAIDVAIDATGDPAAGIAHALLAIAHKKHIVMVNVEADVLAGPLLARRARQAGVVYSMASGDQPALICEQVDWARACGFDVVGAGKGTKYLPAYHASTPETVWGHYGLTPERAQLAGMNPKMFNSFLDGSKSGIEMAAVANATGLTPQPEGLNFPACGVQDLARVCRPRDVGGQLGHKGAVEVVSSLERDGRPVVGDLRWGVWVSFEAPNDYVQRCFAEYGLITDDTGRYTAMWRPYHLIGLELGISVASVALRGEATGQATGFRGDVVATAKRDLKAGEMLDGEGGYTVWGKLMPAAASLARNGLPLGLTNNAKLKRAVKAGESLSWADVSVNESAQAVQVRREMEALFRQEGIGG
ncbi:MAG TPA: SAF domain-containing protein [Candidatus Cybelea sp.]|nr:SAF domain-containing protein [Candidatus Cybelea sp.]